jgi:hypothetical protein
MSPDFFTTNNPRGSSFIRPFNIFLLQSKELLRTWSLMFRGKMPPQTIEVTHSEVFPFCPWFPFRIQYCAIGRLEQGVVTWIYMNNPDNDPQIQELINHFGIKP